MLSHLNHTLFRLNDTWSDWLPTINQLTVQVEKNGCHPQDTKTYPITSPASRLGVRKGGLNVSVKRKQKIYVISLTMQSHRIDISDFSAFWYRYYYYTFIITSGLFVVEILSPMVDPIKNPTRTLITFVFRDINIQH